LLLKRIFVGQGSFTYGCFVVVYQGSGSVFIAFIADSQENEVIVSDILSTTVDCLNKLLGFEKLL